MVLVEFTDKTEKTYAKIFQFYFTKLRVLVENFTASESGNKVAFNKTELKQPGTRAVAHEPRICNTLTLLILISTSHFRLRVT